MLSTVTLIAAETAEHGEPAVNPYWIGAATLVLLLVLVLAVVSFGGGREHS